LPLPLRRRIVALGANPAVDVELVREAAALANPPGEEAPVLADPPADSPPEDVREAFGSEMPISDAVWVQLLPLDRYALAKVAARRRPERLRAAYDEIVGSTAVSTHLGARGGAHMVDVGQKASTLRRAVSRTEVTMNAEAFARLRSNEVAKGDVLGVARVAGIMAAKKTSDLIPLCHPLSLSKLSVDFELDEAARTVRIAGTVEAFDRTGVEMESLVAVSIAALTVYDMLKSVDRAIVIGPTRLVEKSGGRSGDYSS